MLLKKIIFIPMTVAILLSGCSYVDRFVYRPDINQGNYITQEAVDKLKVGQTKEQVIYIMGTPMLTTEFGDNIWYYVFRENPQHGSVSQITYSVFFNEKQQVKEITHSAINNATLSDMDQVPTSE